MGRVLGTIWVCEECLLAHANGDVDPFRAEGLPVPLSAIGEGRSMTLGMRAGDHAEGCPVRITGDHDAAECDCERDGFSRSSCDGCGDWHHGARFAATLWLDRHVIVERRYGPEGLIRRAHCSCGDESFPIAVGWSLEEVAAGHAVDGVLVASPSWGHAECV